MMHNSYRTATIISRYTSVSSLLTERSRVQVDACLQNPLKDPVLRRQHREGDSPPPSVDVRQHAGRGHQHSAGIQRAEPPHPGPTVSGQGTRRASVTVKRAVVCVSNNFDFALLPVL